MISDCHEFEIHIVPVMGSYTWVIWLEITQNYLGENEVVCIQSNAILFVVYQTGSLKNGKMLRFSSYTVHILKHRIKII